MTTLPSFDDFFQALWGLDKSPFPWKTQLADRAATRPWPDAIDLPTAAGKTACLDIAIWALAAQAERPRGQRCAARRIWFVVDRRIVVDEAFDRAKCLANKLATDSAPAIRAVAERLLDLRGMPSRERPLAVGRLRGGVLRDDHRTRIPSQPAIITSTVDQLGSRLLFRSYGDSQLAAPIYAGLAANDSLILLDEAHCAVPFLQTLRAIRRFRSVRWSEVENDTPFHVVVLSATPPAAADGEPLEAFPAPDERAGALDHPVLQRRLNASKPAVLESVPDEEALTRRLTETAADFARAGKRRVGVIVNRVGRASDIAESLRAEARKGPAFDVDLLTGRIRPFERDLLVGPGTSLHRVLRATNPEEPSCPLILVATQCLEVGADFSFDALVTECASLDALRQRFGRLNRLGLPGDAPALIAVAQSQIKDPDPIYGDALKATWEFLQSRATGERSEKGKETRRVDFGIHALTPLLPVGNDRLPLLAPAPDAPILLPAHLDLLCQTSPSPHPEPDLAPFLHGKGRGQPEVRVVWRCDLDPQRPEDWPEILSLCRPVVGEMLPMPLFRLRQWMRDRASADPTGDVESSPTDPDSPPARSTATPFLIWRGRERSEVHTDPARIPPGAVVILSAPANPTDADALGQALREQGLGADRLDLWELAWQKTGRPASLRLHHACLAPWLPTCPPLAHLLDFTGRDDWTLAEIRDALAAVRDWTPETENCQSLPDWLRHLFVAVADVRKRDVAVHPDGGLVLRAPAAVPAEEPDLFADEDDQWSEAPEEVLLADHTEQVEQTVGVLARSCLDEAAAALLQAAARWHDAGKLDPRFQALLRVGLPDLDRPLAKSPEAPRSREQARRTREAAGLPEAFRHEMLSLQLAERLAASSLSPQDCQLFLHLIASHHGHARPLAPVCTDPAPPPVEGQIGGVAISLTAADRQALTPPHRLDSGVGDRYWRLVRRFGWWGLAYREAILRLADWHASAHPKTLSAAPASQP